MSENINNGVSEASSDVQDNADVIILDEDGNYRTLREAVALQQPLLNLAAIQAITDAENRVYMAEYDDFTPVTLLEVLTALHHRSDRREYANGRADAVENIVVAIMETITTTLDDLIHFDPWPELTREKLRAMVGEGRRVPDQGLAWMASDSAFATGRQLSLADRLLAHRHRAWLEKGLKAPRRKAH